MIARLVRKMLCRMFGHVYRRINEDAPASHPGEWWCRRCGFLPYQRAVSETIPSRQPVTSRDGA